MALFAVLRTAALFKSRAETKKNQYTNVLAACTLLDIPTGWDPRTNQSPTGALITSPTARPVLLQIPRGDKKEPVHECVSSMHLVRHSYGLGPAG